MAMGAAILDSACAVNIHSKTSWNIHFIASEYRNHLSYVKGNINTFLELLARFEIMPRSSCMANLIQRYTSKSYLYCQLVERGRSGFPVELHGCPLAMHEIMRGFIVMRLCASD